MAMISECGFNYPGFIELSELFGDDDIADGSGETGVTEDTGAIGATENTEGVTEPKKKRKKRGARRLLIELLAKIALTAAAVWFLLTYVAGVYVNHGNSAYPMIKDGDLVITLLREESAKGDLLAIETEKGMRFQRVTALAGDIVNIADGCVVVNGYAVENTVYETMADETGIKYPYEVPEGCAFVLNDYRSDTYDSRQFGAVPLEGAKGKVIFIARKRGV